ncbi:Uncharacterised protein [Serratia liquefaciens]|uniref:hypothetical protein n=1 Tax=Serratia liquefaciens TaxID=614 RepID=UPI00217BE1AB|nr:hypothetical protein [Serratia liquefaciens]CAI1004997.1 Uncharacterised protein [Serratia liquefaciens]CAI1031569.1 Uncharacterised protein [Serratia liquefaciens]
MSLDSATFPLVWMRQQAAGEPKDTLAEFAEFSTLLQREQQFVLLCDRRMDESGEQDRDERTQVALWKRDHREALAKWVKGMVLIEPDDMRRKAAEEFVDFASRFWGYPVMVVASEQQAHELAQRLLEQREQ